MPNSKHLTHGISNLVSLITKTKFGLSVPQAQKSSWTHLMAPLDNESQVEARFGPFGESANLDAR
jgi:hypothetical protein